MTYKPDDVLFDLIMECIEDHELSVETVHDLIIEACAAAVEHHTECLKKSQELFDIMRGSTHEF